MRVSPPSRSSGFTIVELLVAGAMSAAFFTAAALTFKAFAYNRDHYHALVPVTVNPTGDLDGMMGNFYWNLDGQTSINAYGAPAYGRAAAAHTLYDRFWEDVEKSSAVFCLSRNGKLNTIREDSVTFPAGAVASEIDTNTAFLFDVLIPSYSSAADIYTDYRNVSPVPSGSDPLHQGGTIFVLQPYNVADQLGIRATYELDLLRVSNPSGVYASVRRYVMNPDNSNRDLSDFYDVFYEDAKVSDFGPFFVAFEKSGRLVYPETSTDSHGVAIDSYKVAPRAPFFMMFWPDPAFMLGKDGHDLDGTALSTGDVRTSYFKLGAKTGLMGVVPFFPPF